MSFQELLLDEKYAIERILGKEMSALGKGSEHKAEQRILRTTSSNPSTCGVFITMRTEGSLSEACVCVSVYIVYVGRGVCTVLLSTVTHKKTKQNKKTSELFLPHFLKQVIYSLLNDYNGQLISLIKA